MKGECISKGESLEAAERFLEKCIIGGLAHSFDVDSGQWVKAYPEVTGYLLSYFAQDFAEGNVPKVIVSAANKLVRIQHRNGGFASFSDKNRLFTFDTAQIMHGLASFHVATKENRWLEAAIRAANFVCDMQLPDGSFFPIYDLDRDAAYVEPRGQWGISFSPIQTKNIEGLILLHQLTGKHRYAKASDCLITFGQKACNLSYTHPGAYCLEGLWAAGKTDFVQDVLKNKILPRLHSNGFFAIRCKSSLCICFRQRSNGDSFL
ncbi:prenyltransferase/squalene oxidase repeat-containing protein [Geobacter sp. OR-1]|uniref:prenyltransferase/squalene oxidase repeat-containing protein n=1 Tax=Geobacter sp. OR-1 TaxID=1266765 RepID=UPI001269A91E|nr:prenyltransferase/squalene oxidase repeat-containing protein [Geobacter sp. OR-1]